MTHDENETARELIADALSDLGKDVPAINSPLDLARMVAQAIRDDHEQREKLINHAPACALLVMNIHDYGKLNPSDNRELGGLEVEALALCPHSEAPLLDQLANTRNAYAYALATAIKPDDEPVGVLLLMATRDNYKIAAIAIDNDDKSADAYLVSGKDTALGSVPDDMAATLDKLAGAIARTVTE